MRVLRRRRSDSAEVVINDHTLVEVVDRYLRELDNPAPDYGMRLIYRDWMREFVEAHGNGDAA